MPLIYPLIVLAIMISYLAVTWLHYRKSPSASALAQDIQSIEMDVMDWPKELRSRLLNLIARVENGTISTAKDYFMALIDDISSLVPAINQREQALQTQLTATETQVTTLTTENAALNEQIAAADAAVASLNKQLAGTAPLTVPNPTPTPTA